MKLVERHNSSYNNKSAKWFETLTKKTASGTEMLEDVPMHCDKPSVIRLERFKAQAFVIFGGDDSRF